MYRVMLVDDEPHVLYMLMRLVDWASGDFQVCAHASNGQEALDMLSDSNAQFDLVLTDLNMPVMDGFELIRRIGEKRLGCAVVVLSVHNDYDSIREAFRLGALDYILKREIDSQMVLQVLKGALNNRRFAARKDLIQAQFAGAIHGARQLDALEEKFSGASMLLCVCAPRKKAAAGEEQIAKRCRQALEDYPDYLICQSGAMAVMLLRLNPSMTDKSRWMRPVYVLARKVNEELDQEELIFGVSQPITGAEQIEEAYAQACKNLENSALQPEALVYAAQAAAAPPDAVHTDQGRNSRLIEKAASYIRDNYAQSLTLGQVARHVGLSPSYFSGQFAAHMGKSFSAYLVDVRIAAAQKMLSERTDAKIYEIASACGFASVEHFSRTFKNETGVSPIRYNEKKQGPKP